VPACAAERRLGHHPLARCPIAYSRLNGVAVTGFAQRQAPFANRTRIPLLCHELRGCVSTKRYAVADVCPNPAPAIRKAAETGPFCFLLRDRALRFLPNFCPAARRALTRVTCERDRAPRPASLFRAGATSSLAGLGLVSISSKTSATPQAVAGRSSKNCSPCDECLSQARVVGSDSSLVYPAAS